MSRVEYVQLEQMEYRYSGPISVINKYKIGDKIRLSKDLEGRDPSIIYTILDISKNSVWSICQIDLIAGNAWFDERWLEKVI